jgi:hypothetical protein
LIITASPEHSVRRCNMLKAAKKASALLVAVAALALVGQVAGAGAAFGGSDRGHFTVTGKACGPRAAWARVDIRGTGTATRIGKYSYSALECFDGKLKYAGVFWMRAADGDILSGSYAGTVAGTSDPNVATYKQQAVISGGTGRYEGASGEFEVDGRANLKTGAYSQRLSGAALG